MFKISKSIIEDLLHNWTLWLFTLFLMIASFGLFYVESHSEKSMLGVLNISLLLIPAFSLIFSVIYYFNSNDFITILLVQPIDRSTIILSFMLALSILFVSVTCIGIGLPLLINTLDFAAFTILGTSIFLAIIFVCIGVLIGVYTREKSHGLGVSLVLLFYFSLLFDGIVLLLIYTFSDYPVEKYALYITFLNPIDLSRVVTLMQADAAALMGYTGAVFKQFYSASTGLILCIAILMLWIVVPVIAAVRKFTRKSF